MKSVIRALCLITMAAIARSPAAPVPALDDLAADWLLISDLHSYPSVNNFSGALQTESNVLGITNLKFPPFAQGGDTAVLSVNGNAVALQQSRWFPYQVERAADTAGLHIDTVVRMPFEQQGVLFSVTVTNTRQQTLTPAVSVALRGYIRSMPGTWVRSQPVPAATGYSSSLAGNGSVLVVSDSQGGTAATAFAFATPPATLTTSGTQEGVATWTPTLASGESVTLQFVLAAGANSAAAVSAAAGWAGAFPSVYSQAQSLWEQRWQAAFQPGNSNFSGSLPVLDTTDAKLRRLYYMSALTVLQMERTNLPKSPRVYVTGAPDQATTDVYFWDTSVWSNVWAQLDPVVMKSQCEQFLGMDFGSHYSMDFISGNPIGYWYGADDVSVFQLWWSYLTTTGDWTALNDVVGGQTVLQHLSATALHWQSLVPSGATLADYGSAANIFSIDTNYIHQVASLNAGNVWMMRRMGDIYTRLGQAASATAMYNAAAAQAPNVLGLYNGDGTWNCNENGLVVNVRHVYDYIMLGRCMAEDLSGEVRSAMTSFVEKELVVPGWIRAMSLSDPYLSTANASLAARPDHGYTGAYDAWPATATGVMMQFGDYDKALSLLENCEAATHVGPFSQSHQIFPVSNHVGITVPDYPAIDPTATLTAEAWINASAWQPNSYQGSIISKDDTASGRAGYVLRCGNNGALSFVVVAGGNYYEALTGPVASLSGWHHVAGTYDGSRVRVFLDGVEKAAVACTAALTPSSYPLCVGRGTFFSGRNFIGAIDGVRVYGRALPASELSTQVALGGSYSPSDTNALVLDLPLNEGAGTTTANRAGGNPGGTLFDSTAWTAGIQGSAILIPPPSTDPNNVYVGIGSQIYNESNGAAFADAILTGSFGFTPRFDGSFQLASATVPRGFTGTLRGVRYGGAAYDIVSAADGLSATRHEVVMATAGHTLRERYPLASDANDSLGVANLSSQGAGVTFPASGGAIGGDGYLHLNGNSYLLASRTAGSAFSALGDYTTFKSFSLSFWIRQTPSQQSGGSATAAVIGMTTNSTSSASYYTGFEIPTRQNSSNSNLQLRIRNGGPGTSDAGELDSGRNLSDGNWHQVALTYAGDSRYVYIDGVYCGANSIAVPITTNPIANFTVGAFLSHGSPLDYWIGDLNDLQVYDGTFSAADALQLFQNPGQTLPDTSSLSPYSQWLVRMFGADASDIGIAGPTAIRSSDGIPNLLKYAFNSNPAVADPACLPIVSASSDTLVFTYRRNDEATELTYIVEQSIDLANWTAAESTETILSDLDGTTTIQVQVPLNGAPETMLRLRVSLP